MDPHITDWTAGYVADIGYTYGYYGELNPLRVSLAFAQHGLLATGPNGDGAACELGFGQGLSANIHAAASGVSWWGTDFNPAQAGLCQCAEGFAYSTGNARGWAGGDL